ncbi:hypothetical protein [Sphingomonas beigongshangi]|jgi:hypothetical protein|nr:hypothetical protein [Sphingomonas beigongshangi]
MDGLLAGLAENVIEWVDDRFGRTAAWIDGVQAAVALTIGAFATALALLA